MVLGFCLPSEDLSGDATDKKRTCIIFNCFVLYPIDILKFSLGFITYVSSYSVMRSRLLPPRDKRLKKTLQFHRFPLKLISHREDAFNHLTCSHGSLDVPIMPAMANLMRTTCVFMFQRHVFAFICLHHYLSTYHKANNGQGDIRQRE
jgi:hypothetical protein